MQKSTGCFKLGHSHRTVPCSESVGPANTPINRINRRKLAFACATISLLVSAATSHAAENCSGFVSNVIQTISILEIGKGHTLVSFIAHSATASENSPMTTSGECTGYVLTTPDGQTRAAGACARRTKAGDSFSDIWSQEPGAERGTWKMVGGTGVFAGKAWSGWFQDILDDGKAGLSRFSGNCN